MAIAVEVRRVAKGDVWLATVAIVAAVGAGIAGAALLGGALAGTLPSSLRLSLALAAIAAAALLAITGLWLMRMRYSLDRLNRAIQSLTATGETSPARLPRTSLFPELTASISRLFERTGSAATSSDLLATNRLLARENRRLRRVLDTAGDGILLADGSTHVLFASKLSRPFLKVPQEDAVGKHLLEVVNFGVLQDFLRDGIEAGGGAATRILELPPNPDAGVGEVQVQQTVALDEKRESQGQLIVFRDISRTKNIERLQKQFVDSVAHELRTPLTSIRAYVEMLIDGEAKDPQAQYDFFNIIYEETYRLTQLIDNLLNISMMESGMAKLDIGAVRLKRVIEDAVEVVRGQCEKKNIELLVNLPDRLPTLNLDKALFSVALINVLGNAAKYTPDGGRIILETPSNEEELHIEVNDSGIGIAEEDLPRIFEKFYRAASAADAPGSGIGLATALHVVRLHGGDIRVSSKLGEGSRFLITLPRSLVNTSIGE